MNESIQIVFGLLGGLAMFLYGMNRMSEGLQKVAGERMRQILGFLTQNPVMGALAGALVTAVLQSSSAVTVMVIGFVSAGLMSLPQAVSVIFGANIGTTMTAQLLAFKISDYIYPLIFTGFILDFLGKKQWMKNIGMVIFSFGLLFEGIEIMGMVMKPLADSPVFVEWMEKVSDFPVLGVMLGAGMTLLVQSSSATIAVLQNFAAQAGPDGVSSVIGLRGAVPILLGDNIGTTITALLASIGQSKNAKRTALAHSVFNISGSMVFIFLIPIFVQFVVLISPKGDEVDVIARQIANAHTTFNILCTLIWLPLIPVMVKIVRFLVRGEDTAMQDLLRPQYLDNAALNQPSAAVYLASQEISRCAGYALELIQNVRSRMTGEGMKPSREDFQISYNIVKHLTEAVSSYIGRLITGGGLTEIQAEKTAGLLFVVNHIRRAADRCEEIDGVIWKLYKEEKKLSAVASEELEQCFRISQELFESAVEAVKTGNEQTAQQVIERKNDMRKAQKKFNKAHLSRVKKGICDASLTGDFSSVLYSMDRIMDSCVGIAEEAMDHISFIELKQPNDVSRNSEKEI